MKNICSHIDHVTVLCERPQFQMENFQKLFGLPDYIPVSNHGYYEGGLLHLGNVDIQFLRLGDVALEKPFLYGIGFAEASNIDVTVSELIKREISFSPPLTTTINAPDELCWTVTLLKNFLDEPLNTFYLSPKQARSNFLFNLYSKIINWLDKSTTIKGLINPDAGRSLCMICDYAGDQSRKREKANLELEQVAGGNYQITGVDSIIIETTADNNQWQKLYPSHGFSQGPKIEFIHGGSNQLVGLKLKTRLSEIPKRMHFGDFSIDFIAD